jgi:hypothetical protein
VVSACTHAASAASAEGHPAPPATTAACGTAQWAFAAIRPVGGGGTVFLPLLVKYVSGPRCDLMITLTARLAGPTGLPALRATRAIRAVIGPAAGERQTPLYAFGWSNWCHASREPVRVTVSAPGHATTVLVAQRPECLQASRPPGLNWTGNM